jgi:hypothetical protein
MTSSIYFTAALILAASQSVPAVRDPLGPARSGQLQCFTPDPSRKTCGALAGYTWTQTGAIRARADILMAPASLLIVMRTSTFIDVRSGAVCGRVRARDIEASTFTIAGAAVPQQMVQLASPQILSVMGSHINQEICATFVPNGAGFTTQLTIDGVAHPEISRTFIWVRPDEGYAVAP